MQCHRLAFASLFLLSGVAAAEPWPGWRGWTGDGRSAERDVPLRWDREKNVRWKASLPQDGNGSPVVWAARVFVPCALDREGHRRGLFCFARDNGRLLWMREVEYA